MKRSVVLAAAAAAALALSPHALAGERIDAAVNALRSDSVYVDPAAELAIDEADKARLKAKIYTAGAGPVYIAVLSEAAQDEAGGSPDGVVQAIHDGLGRRGTYAVI